MEQAVATFYTILYLFSDPQGHPTHGHSAPPNLKPKKLKLGVCKVVGTGI